MSTNEVQCTCSAIRQAARQITQIYDAELAASGLRVTQYSVLSNLNRLGPSSVQDLAAEMVMDRSTLGHNLRPLERDGLIKLAVDRNDKRARRLELTARGKARLDEARPLWRSAQARFDASFGASSAKELRTVLRRVVDSTAH